MIIEFKGKRPQIHPTAYIAPNATIIGDVVIEAEASVWFGAVVRGDHGRIQIGSRTSVQDNVVVHVNGRHNTIIESDVTIGHGVVIEGCHLHAGVLVGMNATVLSGAVVGAGSLVAAGAVVGENQQIPAGVLVAGVPARFKGELSEAAKQRLLEAPKAYVAYGRSYQTESKLVE
ncbi:MAG: gamma carbonic anhydrase family protein [Anaerolineales bacterium]|nr:gamma carbonic anhydrase family protein [Anaerolineales bacterium]MCB8936782.1 gamma carbonic anhydrase family protein [Ardenticatenaceae bacterium]